MDETEAGRSVVGGADSVSRGYGFLCTRPLSAVSSVDQSGVACEVLGGSAG